MGTSSSSVRGRATTSTPKPMVAVDADLLDCPICYQLFHLPIYQCDNGHLICDSCCKKIHNKCPSCSSPIGSNRNRAVEKIVESSSTISCAYMKHGCTEKLSYLTKRDHVKTCIYTPIACPKYSCHYVGALKSLSMHYAEKHESHLKKITFNSATRIHMVIRKYTKGVQRYLYQESNDHTLFLVHLAKQPLGNFVNVTCLAPKGSDMKFSYQLSAKKGEKVVSLISPMELTTESAVAPDKDNCLIISNGFYKSNKNGNSSLILNLVIRKIS